MKRQRGRGRKPGGGGGGNHGNRPLESNGPDVKIRGTAAQIYEKYSQYARDAQSAGDRVKYENLLQHAEHYFRIMVATMPRDRLFQQQGEGGMAMQGQGFQQQGEGGGQPQPAEGGVPGGEAGDPMKVVDDQGGDDDGDYADDRDDDRDGDRDGDRDDQAEAGQQQQQDDRGDNQGDRQGRRRRRGRRRHHEGDRNNPQAGAQNNGNGGGDAEPPREPRSALDSLARRQGAIAGS